MSVGFCARLIALPVSARQTGECFGRARSSRCRPPSLDDSGPIKGAEFHDHVRVMYCSNTQQVNPRFLRIMDEMAKTIGITGRFVKFDHLFRQKIEAK